MNFLRSNCLMLLNTYVLNKKKVQALELFRYQYVTNLLLERHL